MPENSSYCGNCGLKLQNINDKLGTDIHHIIPTHGSKPWDQISSAIKLWVSLLAISGSFGIAGRFTDISSPFFDLCASIIMAAIIVIACLKSSREIIPLFSRKYTKWKLSILETFAALLLISVFMAIYIKAASYLGITHIRSLADYRSNGWPIWSAYILISLVPAIFEELAFRGYIMVKLEKIGNQMESLFLQAAMFSVLHLLPAVFISHFFIGVALGTLRLRYKNIYPCIALHASWNAIVITRELLSHTGEI